MRRCLILVVVLAAAQIACAQTTVYYCQKDGRQQITDQPCEKSGAVEARRLRGVASVKSDIDPMAQGMVCRFWQGEKKRVMDAQYYRGQPVRPAELNRINEELQKYVCAS